MAEFKGTREEFHRYFGPLIRNKIQYLTKKKKKELNFICQQCNKKKELEAAHKKTKSRIQFINEFIKKKNTIKNIDKTIETIIEKHKPIEKHFLFLCSKCHLKYDKKP